MRKEVVGAELAQRPPLEADPRSTHMDTASQLDVLLCASLHSHHQLSLIFMLRREVVGPELAPRLPLEAKANPKYDNFVDDACQLGCEDDRGGRVHARARHDAGRQMLCEAQRARPPV